MTGPELEAGAGALAALGHPTRLAVALFLAEAGSSGANVGTIKAAVGVPGSTLSHHLDRLRQAGAVDALRQERFLYYRLRPGLGEALSSLLAALGQEAPPAR